MAARKTPQDRKPKATTPEPLPTLTVAARGRDWTIDGELFADIDFFEDIDAVMSGNMLKLPAFCRRFLGAEQYEEAKALLRDDLGRVPPQELLALISELISADSSQGVSLGESEAS